MMRVVARGVSLAVLALAVLALAGCGGSSGGGERAVVTAVPSPVPTAGILSVDTTAGSDALSREDAVSGRGALRSLQRALDLAVPGDTIRVRGGEGYYRESRPASGRDPAGIIVPTGGLPGQPLVIEGVPGPDGALPVIDQGRSAALPGPGVAGLVLACVSHVVVRDLVIRNVDEAAITTSVNGCQHQDIVITGNDIANVTGSGLVAGIRLARTTGSRVTDNTIRQVRRSGEPGNGVVGAPGGRSADNVVANNLLEEVPVGVHVHSGSVQAVTGQQVIANIVRDAGGGVLLTAAPLAGPVADTDIAGNLLHRLRTADASGVGIEARLGAAASPSPALRIRANTLVDVDQPVRAAGVTGLEIIDNVFAGMRREVLVLLDTAGTGGPPTLARVDFNVYQSGEPLAWVVARGGDREQSFSDWGAWREAWSRFGASDLAEDPDGQSMVTGPLFRDPLAGDYRLLPGSPASVGGSAGAGVGAWAGDGLPPGPSPR
jgi:hypothetical protein